MVYTYHRSLHQTHRQTSVLGSYDFQPPPPPPLHTKRAIPFNLALRLRRICSSDDTFNLRSNKLNMQYLNKRGYNLSFLKQEIRRVRAIQRNTGLAPIPQTHRVVSLLLSPITLLFVLFHLSKHFHILLLPNDVPKYSHYQPLLKISLYWFQTFYNLRAATYTCQIHITYIYQPTNTTY